MIAAAALLQMNSGEGARESFSCPIMQVNTLSPGNAESVKEMLATVCRIMNSDTFEADITGAQMNRGCRPFFLFRKKRISGPEVLSFTRNIPDFDLRIKAFRNSKVTAETSVAMSRISFRNERLEAWQSGDRARRASSINTLAHEMMHLIAKQGTNNRYKFTDAGQSMPWCDRNSLVSYQIGQIVEEIWLREVVNP